MAIFYKKGSWCTLSPEMNVTPCCKDHDLAYRRGGTKSDRKIADIQFRDAMHARGRRILCWVYYFAVRCFGWVHFNWKK